MSEDVIMIKGGSVTIDHDSKFDDDPNGGRKSRTHRNAKLKELKVNGKVVQPLAEKDRVEIVYTE